MSVLKQKLIIGDSRDVGMHCVIRLNNFIGWISTDRSTPLNASPTIRAICSATDFRCASLINEIRDGSRLCLRLIIIPVSTFAITQSTLAREERQRRRRPPRLAAVVYSLDTRPYGFVVQG